MDRKKSLGALAFVVVVVACGQGIEPPSEVGPVGQTAQAVVDPGCRRFTLTATANASGVSSGGSWGSPGGSSANVSALAPAQLDPGAPSGASATLEFYRLQGGFLTSVNKCTYDSAGSHNLVSCTLVPPGTKILFSAMNLVAVKRNSTVSVTVVESVDDGDACTIDRCSTHAGTTSVVHDPVPVDDFDACTADSCNPTTGVSHVRSTSPGCALPPPPSGSVSAGLPTNFGDDATALFGSQGGISGALDPARASILRGYVFESTAGGAAEAASGVTVKVLGSPDLGSTTTRADGTYEIAVNGGGRVTLDYSKTGSLGAQRAATVKWKDILRVEDVELSSHDGPTTTVTPGAATPKLVLGRAIGASEDSAGARQAAIFVPSGTTSPNLAAPSWSVNLTEYTAGPNGPRRMPGPLPLTSGYTYAFAASIAEAAGLSRVEFNQPLYFYLENFAGFPVGADAPMGSYDRARGEWIPEKSGRVIKVLSVRAPVGGGANIVDLDIDGGTTPETDADLLSILGITTQEREVLATRYAAGKTVWRVPVSHFSDWDVNWGIVPPDGAQVPDVDEPNQSIVPDPQCKKHHASTIHCETQYLSEDVAVAGTPYRLHYTTERTPGRKATLRIPLVSAAGFTGTAPIRVDWRVSVAGRTFEGSAPPNPGQYVDFVFDGLDAFGRVVQGGHPYAVDIYNVYPARYASTSRFGYRSNGSFAINTARTNFNFHTRREGVLDNFDARGLGLGGWTISPHHVIDHEARVLWKGDGTRVAETRGSTIIDTVATSGMFPAWPLPANRLSAMTDIGVGETRIWPMPDGTLLAPYGDPSNPTQVVRLRPSDKTAIREVDFSATFERRGGAISATPDGAMWVTDYNNARIYRIHNGVEQLVMGAYTGAPGDTGIGEGPAVTAALSGWPGRSWAKAAPDGSVYVFGSESLLRRITPDRQIEVVAGLAPCATPADGGAARNSCLPNGVVAITFDTDGGVYMMRSNSEIWRIDQAGRLKKVGGAAGIMSGDDGPVMNAGFYQPSDMAMDGTGHLFILENGWSGGVRVREVDTTGIIHNFAGMGTFGGLTGDGGPAARALFGQNHYSLAVAADGALYVSENGHIRRIRQQFSSPQGSAEAIASEDQTEFYLFDSTGRHLKTINSLTGATLEEFGYDAAGRLVTITNGDGLVTTIVREAGTGKPLSITAPHGQSTSLAVGANGFLESISNPLAEAWQFQVTLGGLLEQTTDVRGGIHGYRYDAVGRLASATDPGGNTVRATGGPMGNGRQSTTTTAEGFTNTYTYSKFAGVGTRGVASPGGAVPSTTVGPDGARTVTTADGMVTSSSIDPDPRFGMLAPVTTTTTTTPAGRTRWSKESRASTLGTAGDPWSVTSHTTTVTTNAASCGSGAGCASLTPAQVVTSSSHFDRATRTVTSTSPLGRVATQTLDTKDRVVNTSIPGVAPVSVVYDSEGRIHQVAQAARTVTYDYWPDGTLMSVTDPASRVTTYTRNAAGRLTSTALPGGRTLATDYDAAHNLTSVTPPGSIAHTQAYDLRDLMASYSPPAVAGVNAVSTYDIDRDRRLRKVGRSDGGLTFGYNATTSLLDTVTSSDASKTFLRLPDGRTSTITTGDGVGLAFAYDGRLLTSAAWSGPFAKSVSHTYNHHLARSTTNIAGTTATWAYDADDLLVGATGIGVALTIARDAQNGRITGTTVGQVVQTLGFDSTYGELGTVAYAKGATPLYSVTYTRDPLLGRVTSKSETIGTQTVVSNYQYDAAGRLSREDRGGAITSWAYDGNGNRTTVNNVVVATFDAQERVVNAAGTSFTHDDNGNVLSKATGPNTTNFTWDRFGNLRMVQGPGGSVTYVYDGLNRRIGKKVGGALQRGWIYDGQLRVIGELDSAGTVQKWFVYGSRKNVPDIMVTSAGTFQLISDQLGSVRRVVNAATGEEKQRIDYDAWGKIVNVPALADFQPFGFAGGLYDPDTKLVHFGAREYDPELGRWLSKDEARWRGGLNFYAYAANDPVDLVDTSGRTPGAAVLPGPWAAPAAAGTTGVASKSAGQVIVEVAFFGGLFWLVGEQVFATAPPDDEGEREGGVDGLSAPDASDAGACDKPTPEECKKLVEEWKSDCWDEIQLLIKAGKFKNRDVEPELQRCIHDQASKNGCEYML